MFFQLPDALAKAFQAFAGKRELRQIHNGVIAQLEFAKPQVAINGKPDRLGLMQGNAPAMRVAKLLELPQRLFHLTGWANRISQRDRYIRSHAIRNKTISGQIEEIRFVRPELEVIQGRPPVLL